MLPGEATGEVEDITRNMDGRSSSADIMSMVPENEAVVNLANSRGAWSVPTNGWHDVREFAILELEYWQAVIRICDREIEQQGGNDGATG